MLRSDFEDQGLEVLVVSLGGVGLIVLLGFGFFVNESLIVHWPALWPIDVSHIDYVLNRAWIALRGRGDELIVPCFEAESRDLTSLFLLKTRPYYIQSVATRFELVTKGNSQPPCVLP